MEIENDTKRFKLEMVLESQKEKKKVKDREYEERKLNEERKI